MTDIFDNSPDPSGGDNAKRAAASELNAYAQRIARLNDERAVLSEDIKEIYAEAKQHGYDTKALRTIVSLMKKDDDTRAAIKLYGDAMGIFG